MSLAELIKERRSIRKCNSTPVDQELIVELLRKATRLQPFVESGSWRVVYAGTPEARKRLVDCMLEQMSQSKLGKLIPGKLLDVFKKRFTDIPAHVIVMSTVGPDRLTNDRNYAAACGVMQSFQLLGWERGLGMLWDTESMIQHEGFFNGIGLREDERFVGILHIGYYDKAPRSRKRTPAEQKWTVLRGQST
ncbi:nitroreductase family protein [Paenibacillus xylanexedens]|uniref:Nitroreductase n=1 Tax=Paenibacillus xylanexedens TaxID=528191 RepID=A0ABS4S344_PAEXY|nr:nitroreductase [Paenibacillus xylanexedens]MBP2249543.1 nitroreductase [Paenibacillus xylanexedens]